jgi:histidine phosphotransferase ChpT
MGNEALSGSERSAGLRLAEFVAARLCHDLSGPVGTLIGALELMVEENDATAEAARVAEEAALVLKRRMRLLRAAWAEGTGEMGLEELLTLAEGMPGARRVQIDTSALKPEAVFAGPAARLLLNVLMLGAESLPAGGRLVLIGSPTQEIAVLLEGARAGWPPMLVQCLVDEAGAWSALTSARAVQAPLTALIARYSGLGLSFMLPGGPSDGENTPPPPLLLSFAAR